jgi:hypothetical protein
MALDTHCILCSQTPEAANEESEQEKEAEACRIEVCNKVRLRIRVVCEDCLSIKEVSA